MPPTMPSRRRARSCCDRRRAPWRAAGSSGRFAITRMPGWLEATSAKGRSPSNPSVRVIAIMPVPVSTLMYLSGYSTSISMSPDSCVALPPPPAGPGPLIEMNTDPPAAARRRRQLASIGAPDRQALEAGELLLAAERLARRGHDRGGLGVGRLRAPRAPAPSARTRAPIVIITCVIRMYVSSPCPQVRLFTVAR